MSNPLLPINVFDELAALKRRLDTLERSTGYQQSITLADAAGTTRIQLGRLGDGSYGLVVNDAAGVARFLTTPNGIQVNNAAGGMLMDSIGMAGTATVLANSYDVGGHITYTTTYTDVPTSTMNFTVGGTRAVNVLLLSSTVFYTSGGTSTGGSVKLHCSNGTVSAVGAFCTVNIGVANAFKHLVVNLSPGTYSVNWQGRLDAIGAGTTLDTNNCEFLALQLGG